MHNFAGKNTSRTLLHNFAICSWVNSILVFIALWGPLPDHVKINVASNVAPFHAPALEDVYTYMWNSEILDRGLSLPDVQYLRHICMRAIMYCMPSTFLHER